MKHFATLLLAALALSFAARLDATVYLATINGTISSQVLLGPTEGRIETDRIDNDRVFQAFGLSKDDYAIVFDTDFADFRFRQKDTGGALPDVPIFDFAGGTQAINTRTGKSRLVTEITSPATGNIFEGLTGTALGAVTFSSILPAPLVDKISLKIFAKGHHPDPSSSGGSILRLAVKTGREL